MIRRDHGVERHALRYTKPICIAAVATMLMAATSVITADAAQATIATDEQSAAQIATAAGYRTGVAVLDLKTGAYYGAGQDTASFASESVAKVFIATELLLTGQMSGTTETTAYQMITESDDDDADDLYGVAGGDDVINLVAAHYNLPTLGTAPSNPGWWGSTQINAKAMVYLYAAIAKDPVVGPWLMNAMANATEYGADGTDQFFGIPSATTGAAIKQGWGDDGTDSPNAVFNSTGFVDDDTYAVAILTDGSPDSYGTAISDMVTSEAQALMPGGILDDPADHNPVISTLAATATGSTVQITGMATDSDTAGPLSVQACEGGTIVASGSTASSNSFALSFLADNGTHTYTVTVINVGEGTANTTAATPALTVDGSPQGAVTSVTGGPGDVTITGEEANPNLALGQDPAVIVTINGHAAVVEPVNEPTAAPASSTGLIGYSLAIPASAGHDTVTVAYLGTDGAPSITQGTWPVTVADTAAQRRDAELRVAVPALAVVILLTVLGLTLALRRRAQRAPFPNS